MKITAYKCKYCSNIFEHNSDMIKCRRKCLATIKSKREEEKKRKETDILANSIRLEISSIHEFPSKIEQYVKNTYNRTINITNFDVWFKSDLAPTHNAPVGKNTEWSGSTRYMGWIGRIHGHQKDLINNPIKCNRVSFREIRSILDLRYLIKGFNIESGGGGSDFSYSVHLYLDDFPKIKAKYDQYNSLRLGSNAYREKAAHLVDKAQSLITENKDIVAYNKAIDFFNIWLKKAHEKRSICEKNIRQSKEYKRALVVPDEYNYDKELYAELCKEFE